MTNFGTLRLRHGLPGVLEILGGRLSSLTRGCLIGDDCHLFFSRWHSTGPREAVPSLELTSRRRYFIHVEGFDGTSLRRLNSLERLERGVSVDLIEPLGVERLVLGFICGHREHVELSAA